MNPDAIVLLVWLLATPVAALFTGWAFATSKKQYYWIMLCAPMVAYLLTDAMFLGGFQLDGVVGFPVFAGIVMSMLWFIIFVVSSLIGQWIKKRRRRLDATS